MPPIRGAAFRFAVASVILSVLIAWKRLPLPNRRELRDLLVLSVTMMALPYGLLFWAERSIASSTTAVLFSSLPLATAALTPWMTGVGVPRRTVFAIVVAFGALPGVFSGVLRASPQQIPGMLAVLAAVLCGAWASLFAKQRISGVHPVVGVGVQFACAAVLLFAVGAVAERSKPAIWTGPAIWSMCFLVLCGSVIAFSLYYWLLRHMEATQLATVQLVVPVIAIAEGALLGKERVPVTVMAAAACILACVFVVITTDQKEDAFVSIAGAQ